MTQQIFRIINPATEAVVEEIPGFATRQIAEALHRAEEQAREWPRRPWHERTGLLRRVAELLEAETDVLAARITREMGKLIGEAGAEIEKCAWVCRYYAEGAEGMLGDQAVATDARRSLVAYQPLGCVLAVMPWNFPFWQVFRFAAPAIAAGNVAVLKHASNVMGCAVAIEDLFRRAGAPEGVFTTLPIGADQVEAVIKSGPVRAVTLTGSEAAGRAVAAAAGRELKKTVLELGGSDAFVVLPDADLDRTVAKAVASRFMNAGQSCIAAKRFIVLEAVADDFVERFVRALMPLEPGDPTDPATKLAPMARADLRDELHAQVRDAEAKGAAVLVGGSPLKGRGYYYPASVLVGVAPAMRAYEEELFGPVASVLIARDEAQALRLANDTPFGLGGSVWTEDRERGLRFARELACGCAFVNELVKSDPRLPFGGVKASGYGRELAVQGIREFVNVKTLWVA